VVIDEARRFWDQGIKISEEHLIFFAEHRHYTGPKNVCCDLVYITQDLTSVQRTLKGRTELVFKFKKLKVVGLNNYYNVAQYEGSKTTQSNIVSTYKRKYDAEIFPLYKSYSSDEAGTELAVDRRQNILGQKWIFPVAGALLLLVCVALYSLKGFFSGGLIGSKEPAPVAAPVAAASMPLGPGVKPGQTPLPSPLPAPPPPPKPSETWRIAGVQDTAGGRFVILADRAGRVRLAPMHQFQTVNGRFVSGTVDGEIVGTWSGTLPASTEVRRPRNQLP
jgi:zona occludens toxin